MGRATYYCVQRSKRVTDADLEVGKGYRIGDRILCRTCTPEAARTPIQKSNTASSKKVPAITRSRSGSTSAQMRSVTAPLATPPPEPAPPNRKRRLLAIGGGAAVVVLVVIVLIIALSGKSKPPPSAVVP